MREILFRGKNYKGEWLYGSLQQWYDTFGGDIKSQIHPVELEPTQQGGRVDSTTIGQFTGLVDRNGKRVFEGDIIHVDNYDDGWNSMVEFKGGAFAVDVEGKEYDYTAIGWLEYEVEIIGNIHDNPELVEEVK